MALGLAIGCAEFLAVPSTTAIAAGISQSASPPGEYVLLSKKGGTWFYRVSWEIEEKGPLPKPARKETGTLSILNEGETSYEGLTATRFSWVYGGNISYQVTLYLVSSPAGILTVGSEMRKGAAAIRERFEPPVLMLKAPVAEGSVWDHAGKRIQAGGPAMEYSVRNEYLKHERVTSPAGHFDAIRLFGREASGGAATGWWARGVGLIRREESTASSRSTAELVSYSLPGGAPGTSGEPETQRGGKPEPR